VKRAQVRIDGRRERLGPPLARRRFGYICLALAFGLVLIGAASMAGFLRTPPQPLDSNASENIVMK